MEHLSCACPQNRQCRVMLVADSRHGHHGFNAGPGDPCCPLVRSKTSITPFTIAYNCSS